MTLPAALADLVWEQSVSTGSSNLTTSRRGGYQTGSEAFGTTNSSAHNPYVYIVNTQSSGAQWELNQAFWSTPTTLVRSSTPLRSSNGNALVNFTAGLKFITNDVPAAYQTSILSNCINVQSFGAVGDGSTDDSAAIQAAINYLSTTFGGGIVYCPPTGAAYLLGTGLSCPNGIFLAGSGARLYPGSTASIAQWTASATWFRSTDTVNPTISLNGNGTGIAGINFIRNQVVPTGGAYTPTTFPYEIHVVGTFFTIDNVMTIGSTHDIQIDYNALSGGGTFSRITNFFGGGMRVGIQFNRVNDTMYVANLHHRNNWYSSDANVADFLRQNKIDWSVGYLDNIMADGVEFFQSAIAMLFFDQTCLGNTHSMKNATLNNIQFNLVSVAMDTDADDTDVSGLLTNVLVQSYSDFGSFTSTNELFQLQSSEVDLNFTNMRVKVAGGAIGTVGSSNGGRISINGFACDTYSAAAAGQTAWATNNAGAFITIQNVNYWQGSSSAGSKMAGAGRFQTTQRSHQFFPRYQTNNNVTLSTTATWTDFANDPNYAPAEGSFFQGRLLGNIEVTTALSSARFYLRMQNFPEIGISSGISSSTTGFKSFDTNWIDFTGTLTSFVGRLQITANSSIVIGGAEVSLMLR